MIKKILPFERLVYNSTLSGDELIPHLRNETGTNYTGRIYQNKFEIKRKINYRNSFLPLIKGEITDRINGSRVNVRMDLLIYAKIFMTIWLGGVTLALFAGLYTLIFDYESMSSSATVVLFPFIMLVAGVALVSLSFKYESKKSIKDLEGILKAKITK